MHNVVSSIAAVVNKTPWCNSLSPQSQKRPEQVLTTAADHSMSSEVEQSVLQRVIAELEPRILGSRGDDLLAFQHY